MKVEKIDFPKLHNEEHFEFMTELRNLIQSVTPAVVNLTELFPVFLELHNSEDLALEQIRKNELTAHIAASDRLRDNYYNGLRLAVEAYHFHPDPGRVDAARKMQIVIDHYGDFRSKGYNEETGIITNFVQDMQDRCGGEMNIIRVREWFDALRAENDNFRTLMANRHDDNAAQLQVNMREARINLTKHYALMMDRVDATSVLNSSAAVDSFIKRLNERVAYYKNTIAERKGRSAAKKSESSEPGLS